MAGGDHYARLYEADLAREAEWLERTAGPKADSVEQLLAAGSLRPRLLVELGCGTGALVRECQRRRLAREFLAVDQSEPALRRLRETAPDIEVVQADVATMDLAARGPIDVLLVSHVLEHLEQPRAFLESLVAKADFGHLLVEVPLEDLPLVRWRHRGEDRTDNRAGHVQFFTAATFRALLEAAGLEVVATRRYVPILDRETIRFLAAKNGLTPAQAFRQALTSRVLPRLLGPIWASLCYAHLAALCRKRAPARA
jgi:trans-aconitate methyltransferase